jgi:hypothetical protein
MGVPPGIEVRITVWEVSQKSQGLLGNQAL